MLCSRLTVGVIPGLLFTLYILVIYLPDIEAIVGDVCSTATSCTGANEECQVDSCVCAEGFEDSNGAVAGGICTNLELGSICTEGTNGEACKDVNAACTGGQCTCGPNYYDDHVSTAAGRTCKLKIDLGSNCAVVADEQVCKDVNAACTGGQCTCGPNYYDDHVSTAAGRTCKLKFDLGSNCSVVADEQVCKDSNAACSNGTCVCGSDYYDGNGDISAGTCQPKSASSCIHTSIWRYFCICVTTLLVFAAI